MPRQLRRGADQPRAPDSLHRRIQRLRDLDAAAASTAPASRTRTCSCWRRKPRSGRRRSSRVVSEASRSRSSRAASIARRSSSIPNGADPDGLRAAGRGRKRAAAQRARFRDDDRVIGFSGTFGGWHGDRRARRGDSADLRSERRTCEFLLIGDGSHKPLLDDAVDRNMACRIASQSVGRVPQDEGARLLGAATSSCRRTTATWSTASSSARRPSCSNTWRWAAASSPAISSSSAKCCRRRCGRRPGHGPTSPNERAVLCTPGDVDEFVDGGRRLLRRRRRSARRSAATRGRPCSITTRGTRHVERVWRVRAGERVGAPRRAGASRRAGAHRHRRRLQGRGPEPVEQQSGRLALREGAPSRTRSNGSRKSRRTATASTRRGCRRDGVRSSTPARTCSRSAAASAPT